MLGTLMLLCSAIVTTLSYGPDEVTFLPGLHKQPSFRHFSGYVNATHNRYLHYWFAESQSSPEDDPLVLWLNGGPACSSLLGFLTENGPFTVQEGGKTLQTNPYSWNRIANLLVFESPAGVGFSYSSDGNVTSGDNEITLQHYNAIVSFYQKFPEYKRHKLYISGESYAGFYVPLLSDRLIKDKSLNFQGFLLGNPISKGKFNTNALIYFSHYHGLIGETLWQDLLRVCCGNNATRCDFVESADRQCHKLVDQALKETHLPQLNEYNIYDNCGKDPVYFDKRLNKYVVDMLKLDPTFYFSDLPFFRRMKEKVQRIVSSLPADKLSGSLACDVDHNLFKYLNQPDVRAALHVKPHLPTWIVCSPYVHKFYHMIYHDMTDQYKRLLATKRRFFMYVGDFDTSCNFIGNEWFVNSLELREISQRKPWYYKDEEGKKLIGGWAHAFEGGTFTTVRGAGHMVPTNKPLVAFNIFQHFINDQPL